MTKLITVTGRFGVGKTTVAAILAEKLAEKYTVSVCLINNNKDNINIYKDASTVDDINLYACIADKESCSRAIKESATKIKKNMFFFSGGYEPLTEEQIQILKELDIFDYIILDSEYEIDNSPPDFIITVVNQNVYEYETATKKMNLVTSVRFIDETFKSIIIINRYSGDTEFKVNSNYFKLYFCPEIINFANGYELNLPEENKKEIKRLIEKITGEKSEGKTKPRFRLFGGI
jgi:CO dehydrogenase nickel-insertion accessory protein CooC1